jgi:bifunctional DNase/RNase
MSEDSTVEMFVHGLVLDPATQAPVIILKDVSGDATLPIWIGIAEATSIASAIKQLNLSRPLTHDLLYEIVVKSGFKVDRVVITELRDSTYYADLILSKGEQQTMVIDARPSDAIAIAVRSGAAIHVAQNVLDQARAQFVQRQGGTVDDPNMIGGEDGPPRTVNEADYQAIDKDKWKQILEDLDPDDFKYKM